MENKLLHLKQVDLQIFSYLTLGEVVLQLFDGPATLDIFPENLISETNMIERVAQTFHSFHAGEYWIVKRLRGAVLLLFVSGEHVHVLVRELRNSLQKALERFGLFLFSVEPSFLVEQFFFYFFHVEVLEPDEMHGVADQFGLDVLIVWAGAVERRLDVNFEEPRPQFGIEHHVEAQDTEAFALLPAMHLGCDLRFDGNQRLVAELSNILENFVGVDPHFLVFGSQLRETQF